MILGIVVCKMTRLVGLILGRGSSFPGALALKICPDILKRVILCENIIAVTGSNGKTSTTELIAKTLQRSGIDVVYNKEGSNQVEGVATLILSNCSLGGRFKREALVIESDERYALRTFKYFSPKYFLITNLFRDQLTRNRHPEWIFEILSKGISQTSKLILNANDPLVASFGLLFDNATYYGVCQSEISENLENMVYDDGRFCPACKRDLSYEYRNFGQLGKFECESCQHKSLPCQFEVTKIDKQAQMIEINSKFVIQFRQLELHSVYNFVAAFTVCALCGIRPNTLAQVMSFYDSQTGRMLKFIFDGKESELLVSKHENATSYNCSITKVLDFEEECSVLIVVDRISRKYFTSETSWLWDIAFERLDAPNVKKVFLSGKYCYDLHVRFKCTNISEEKIYCEPDLSKVKQVLKDSSQGKLFVITCLSDKDKALSKLVGG